MLRLNRKEYWILAVILLIASAWKITLLALNAFPFNADEAVVGLMARHILQGNWPIFFYGQAYMGSLDAILVAGVYLIMGQSVLSIRIVQLILYLLTIITTVEIGRVGFSSTRTGLFAGALMCIPTVNLTLYTTASLGGYGEALFIGNLILLMGVHTYRKLVLSKEINHLGNWFGMLGILTGVGLWSNGLTLVYSAPTSCLAFVFCFKYGYQNKGKLVLRAIVGYVIGLSLGALPWWIFAFQNGFDRLINELLGTAVDVAHLDLFQQLLNRFINFLLIGMSAFLGFRPPWEVRWLALPLIPLVLLFWCWVGWGAIKNSWASSFNRPVYWLLMGVELTLITGFMGTPFGNDPSGRYFLPMTVPAVLIAADLLNRIVEKKWIPFTVMTGLLLFHLIGTWQCAIVNPPGITTQFDSITIIDHSYDQALIAFLKEQNETTGYSNYWVAYPLAFESQETLIYIPRLPYHQDFRYTSRDDRYAPYRKQVETANRVAYITTNHFVLDQYLRDAFNKKGVSFQEQKIGNYQVFYRLSQPLRPEEIGLGRLTQP